MHECVPSGAAAQKTGFDQHEHQPQSSRTTGGGGGRGAEVSDSSPLPKCDLSVEDRDALQEKYDEDSTDSQFMDNKSPQLLVGDFFERTSAAEVDGKTSCSYSMAADDFPSTSSGVNGWTHYSAGFLSQPQICQRAAAKDRLFVCSYCGKAFNRPKKLEIHQRVHTGEKPFSCSTCGKKFSEAGNLRKHQRVHTGEKPYSCGMCGRGFAWIRNLKTHQQKSHPHIYIE